MKSLYLMTDATAAAGAVALVVHLSELVEIVKGVAVLVEDAKNNYDLVRRAEIVRIIRQLVLW